MIDARTPPGDEPEHSLTAEWTHEREGPIVVKTDAEPGEAIVALLERHDRAVEKKKTELLLRWPDHPWK